MLLVSTHVAKAEEALVADEAQNAIGSIWSSWPLTLLIGYCVTISVCSILGGSLSTRVKLTHVQLQLVMSFVGGIMLGTGVFHMMPHALANLGTSSIDTVSLAMMIGMIAMFLMLRAFHFHQHGSADFADATSASQCDHDHGNSELAGVHVHEIHDPHAHAHAHKMSGPGVFLGMAIHTLIDGIALAASFQAEMGHSSTNGLFALGTFLAIALHKPLDAVTITSLMTAGKWSRSWTQCVNVLFALMCPLGVLIFLIGVNSLFSNPTVIVGYALAFAAGVFICIALSDLLPEMEFHSHNRVALTVALLLGIGVSWSVRYLEPSHDHSNQPKVEVESFDSNQVILEFAKASDSSDL